MAAAVPSEEKGVPQVVADCAGVEGDSELQVLEEVNEVVASEKASATKARFLAVERAVVENMIAPVLTDVGGEAAQARKKRHQPVAVLAERASVKEVGALSSAFAGGEVKG